MDAVRKIPKAIWNAKERCLFYILSYAFVICMICFSVSLVFPSVLL